MLSDNTTKVAVELHRLNKSAWFNLGSTVAVAEFAEQVGISGGEFRAAIDELDQYGLIRVDKGMNTPGVPMELRDVAGIDYGDQEHAVRQYHQGRRRTASAL